jgi:hypothetical protein
VFQAASGPMHGQHDHETSLLEGKAASKDEIEGAQCLKS